MSVQAPDRCIITHYTDLSDMNEKILSGKSWIKTCVVIWNHNWCLMHRHRPQTDLNDHLCYQIKVKNSNLNVFGWVHFHWLNDVLIITAPIIGGRGSHTHTTSLCLLTVIVSGNVMSHIVDFNFSHWQRTPVIDPGPDLMKQCCHEWKLFSFLPRRGDFVIALWVSTFSMYLFDN